MYHCSKKLIHDVVIWSGRTDLPSGAAYTFVRCARKVEELEAQLEAVNDINDILSRTLDKQTKRADESEKQLEAITNCRKHQFIFYLVDDIQAIIDGGDFTTLSSDAYAPDNVSWYTHAKEAEKQLEAEKSLYLALAEQHKKTTGQLAAVRDFTESIHPISSGSTVGMIKSKLQVIAGDNDE